MRFALPLISLAFVALAVREGMAAAAVEYSNIITAAYTGGDCDSASFNLTYGCTRTYAYWVTHYSGAATEQYDIAWPGTPLSPSTNLCVDIFRSGAQFLTFPSFYLMSESSYHLFNTTALTSGIPFFAAGDISPLEALDKTKNSPCFVHARQYVTSLNNLCSGACYGDGGQSSPFWAAMEVEAAFLFDDHCQNNPDGNYNLTSEQRAAYTLLERYNNGAQIFTETGCDLLYGPYKCENGDDNITARPCRSVTDECLGDTCVGECTQSQSYWNRNSLNAKSNDTSMNQWASACDLAWVDAQQNINCSGTVFVPGACNATLEKTPYAPWIPALTWRGVLRTAANKDACLIAAKRIITAELNINCGGSCTTETLDSVIAEAKAIMLVECADIVGTGAKGAGPYINGLNDTVESNSTSGANRRRLLSLASYIANYNNGFGVGPGYCDEEITSAITVEEVAAECDSGEKNVINSTDQKVQFVFVIITFCIAVIILAWKVIVVLVKWCRGMPENTPFEESMYRLGRAFETTAAAKFQQPSNPNLRNRFGH